MKFEKNNRYFTIALYAVGSVLLCFIGIMAILNFSQIWKTISTVFAALYRLLKPLILGLVFAYLIDPLVGLYEKKMIKLPRRKKQQNKKSDQRGIATLFAYITVILFIWLFFLVISLNIKGFEGFNNINMIASNIQLYIQSFTGMLTNLQRYVQRFNFLRENMTLVGQVTNVVRNVATALSNKIIGIIATLGSNVMNILLGFVIAFYLLSDKKIILEKWNRLIDAILPSKVTKEARVLWSDIDSVLSGYIRGQLTDSLIVGVLTSIILTLIGLDFAVIIGIIAGLSNIIPYFGPIVGFVAAGVVGLLGTQPIKGIYAMIAILILQQVDGLIIAPKIVGESLKLHPIVVLLSIVIGGNLFGIFGMLFAVPVAALIRVLLLRYVTKRFVQ